MYLITALTSVLVVGTIVLGVVLNGKRKLVEEHPKIGKRILRTNFSSFVILTIFSLIYFLTGHRAFAEAATASTVQSGAAGLGFLGAALSTGLATIGAGIGVGITGAAGIGSISENPGMLGRTLIYVGLAEGIAIYGLIISIMILGKI